MEYLPLKPRQAAALGWLKDNPTESPTSAARINHKPNEKAFLKQVQRASSQNKILKPYQDEAIRTLLLNVIRYIKLQENPAFNRPSRGWFLEWWHRNKLYKIKTKPLVIVRLTSQVEVKY
ncbi:hypothetical protein CJF30_00011053 [Rutstroemia sp. NJR-2017a BBW]|nr:hypothetical protein CJF30_00011053 [Rutstroemia sp. NJR-2017a BBW]